MRFDPGDLGLKHLDPFRQLILRIRREVLPGELARGIAPGAG